MKVSKKALLLLSTICCAPIAFAAAGPFYSPYKAMTVNMRRGQPEDLVQVSQQTGIQSFTLAFIISQGRQCRPAWDGYYPTASRWASGLTDNMRAAGIKYYISFGGAYGNDISQNCTETQLVDAYEQIISTYQPNGLDFDIENRSVNVSNIMNALQSIQRSHPDLKISFTLPSTLTGLDADGENVVRQAQQANITNYVVNIMTMNFGVGSRGDLGRLSTQAAQGTFNFLKRQYPQSSDAQIWQMIQITPMIGVNDTPREKFTLANTDYVREFSLQHNTYGLSMWALNRDKPCLAPRPRPTCSGRNLQTTPYEFSYHFMGTT